MITILVRAADGTVLASAEHPEEAFLSVDRVWQPGDTVRISGTQHLRVRMDQSLPEGEVFLPEGRMIWPVPWQSGQVWTFCTIPKKDCCV